jgi:hypothetical protein
MSAPQMDLRNDRRDTAVWRPVSRQIECVAYHPDSWSVNAYVR